MGSTGTRSIRVSFGASTRMLTRVPGAVVSAYTAERSLGLFGDQGGDRQDAEGSLPGRLHEVGHVLGLVGHLPAGGNLMARSWITT